MVNELLHASAAKHNSTFSEPFVVKMSNSPPKKQSHPNFMFKTNCFLRSEVLTAVTTNNSVFLEVTPCQNLLPPSSRQNRSEFPQVYIMSHPRKHYSLNPTAFTALTCWRVLTGCRGFESPFSSVPSPLPCILFLAGRFRILTAGSGGTYWVLILSSPCSITGTFMVPLLEIKFIY